MESGTSHTAHHLPAAAAHHQTGAPRNKFKMSNQLHVDDGDGEISELLLSPEQIEDAMAGTSPTLYEEFVRRGGAAPPWRGGGSAAEPGANDSWGGGGDIHEQLIAAGAPISMMQQQPLVCKTSIITRINI